MKNIKKRNTLQLVLHDYKFAALSSSDVVFAGDEDEFFYEGTNEAVPFGEPIGLDIPNPATREIKLVLFKNIYWKPLEDNCNE